MEHFKPIPSYGSDSERAQDINSGEMVVVYEASLASAGKVIELLKKEGLGAVALEQPNSITAHRSANTMLVRIAVPGDQSPLAESILKNWEQNCSQSVTGLTKKLKMQVLPSCALTAIVALCLCVFGYFTEETVVLLVAVWVTAFALLANAHKISQYFKKD